MLSVLEILKLNDDAVVPVRSTEESAGLDLSACIKEDLVIYAGERLLVPTGIAIKLPFASAGMIYARSGLSSKFGICLSNSVGVVDSDYRGEIKIALFNSSNEDYTIKPKERIAQLVVTPILLPVLQEVTSLDETKRGDGGFGSTKRI